MITKFLTFINESKNDKIYYHGRSSTRPYYGKYIYITDSLEYASGFSEGKKLMMFKLPFSEDKIFSIKNPKHLELIKKYVDEYSIQNILDCSNGGEMDWAVVDNICNEDFEYAEDLLENLGFYGIRLKERPETDSILIFDESKLEYIGDVDMEDEDIKKRMGNYFKDFEKKYILNNGI